MTHLGSSFRVFEAMAHLILNNVASYCKFVIVIQINKVKELTVHATIAERFVAAPVRAG